VYILYSDRRVVRLCVWHSCSVADLLPPVKGTIEPRVDKVLWSDLFTGVTEDGVFSSVLASAGLKHGSIFQEVCKHIDVHFSSRATRRDSSA